jgi:hypothetical protein
MKIFQQLQSKLELKKLNAATKSLRTDMNSSPSHSAEEAPKPKPVNKAVAMSAKSAWEDAKAGKPLAFTSHQIAREVVRLAAEEVKAGKASTTPSAAAKPSAALAATKTPVATVKPAPASRQSVDVDALAKAIVREQAGAANQKPVSGLARTQAAFAKELEAKSAGGRRAQ